MKMLYKDRNSYRFIPSSSTFDYLPKRTRKHIDIKPYLLHFRVVRFKISDDCYEAIITNLPFDDFPPEELKRLYAMRWGIETSFKELKFTVGLMLFHAKKMESIYQEIFASLIMYNFTQIIIANITVF